MPISTLILIIVAVAAVAVAAWALMNKRRSDTLRSRFGPEYHTAVRETGDRSKAERELERRAKRVEKFHIVPLSPTDRDVFADRWRLDQARFVDDPRGAVVEADKLVNEVMVARGYPMSEFEQRAADISVGHPHVVHNYRVAHEVVERHRRGEAGTEDLRKAMICYRDLFDELLEVHEPARK